MSLLLAVTAERSPLEENMLLRLITINLTNDFLLELCSLSPIKWTLPPSIPMTPILPETMDQNGQFLGGNRPVPLKFICAKYLSRHNCKTLLLSFRACPTYWPRSCTWCRTRSTPSGASSGSWRRCRTTSTSTPAGSSIRWAELSPTSEADLPVAGGRHERDR